MRYGISNNRGQPDEAEVAAILGDAESLGVGYLDTAFAYPDVETLIGRHLQVNASLKIVTKTTPLDGAEITRESKGKVLDAIATSLDRLRLERVYGVLVHHGNELGKSGWENLVEALEEAQSRGWVGLIGASVYNEQELLLVESRFQPGIIQAPFNILDRRLLSSQCLRRLKSGGAEIHARSVFLQGLLLMPSSELPAFFKPLKPALAALQSGWTSEGLDPLAACLGYVMEHPDIDVAIVGVNSLTELKELHQAAMWSSDRKSAAADLDHAIDPKFLDPSLWPPFTMQSASSR